MEFGRYYEEFEVGAIYKHWPGRTITEYDNTLFALMSMSSDFPRQSTPVPMESRLSL